LPCMAIHGSQIGNLMIPEDTRCSPGHSESFAQFTFILDTHRRELHSD
jgi:hypothetical protein